MNITFVVALLSLFSFNPSFTTSTPRIESSENRVSHQVAGSDFKLAIDISERKLFVIEDGDTLKSYNVAVGAPKHPTPKGKFTISKIIWNPSWVPPKAEWAKDKEKKGPGEPDNPMGKAKLFFKYPDYYIHGTDKESSIGKAASHGCIRMLNSDVVDLAKTVMKKGGVEKPKSWFHSVINRAKTTKNVQISNPVSVHIVQYKRGRKPPFIVCVW